MTDGHNYLVAIDHGDLSGETITLYASSWALGGPARDWRRPLAIMQSDTRKTYALRLTLAQANHLADELNADYGAARTYDPWRVVEAANA